MKQGRIKWAGIGVALAFAGVAWAQEPKLEPMTDGMLRDYLPDDSQLEVRLDGDFNGDGIGDTAYVGGTDEKRLLKIMLGYKDELDWGYSPAGEAELEVAPLGSASLSFKKGVLIVGDLTGGTTATASTYRYRYDPAVKRFRLIGLDAERYSRTNSHDSLKFSWNLLTGARIVQRGYVNDSGQGDEAYRYGPERKLASKAAPVWIDDTPSPDAMLDADANNG
ncbi:hypothetical protein [Lysobacter silvisoli]|uniref:VCBS repeat-containing protein n=1 Tax=Lysobacter silvisoli TaxID=2293254 RepID=A0A371K4J4_9GAMM|nr:hypothetical protein [Lysobacter silvisoli]RDZ28835.1 hypothetical protein DX914_06910 [Lysobacter silvisoli]